MARRLDQAGRALGKEMGRLAGRLEREARVAGRRGKRMQAAARKQSVRGLRRAAWALNKLALQLETAGTGRRRRSSRRRTRRR